MTADIELDELFNSRSRRPRNESAVASPPRPVSPETVSGETAAPRPSSRNRRPARGLAQPPAPERRGPGRPPNKVGERWEDRYRRAAYYLDVGLLDQLSAYCTRTGANKSEVVRDAVAAYLAKNG